MALSSKPKTRPLVFRASGLALAGALTLGGCSESSQPADGGVDSGSGDADVATDGSVSMDTSVANDGGFPDDLGVDDVGIPPMPPPVDGGGLDGGFVIGDGGLRRDANSTFDGGLPPIPPAGDAGSPPPRIDTGPMPPE